MIVVTVMSVVQWVQLAEVKPSLALPIKADTLRL